MKILLLLGLFVSTYASAGADQFSKEKWLSFGSFAAIILPMIDNKADSKFYGLVVECSPSKGTYRISIKDIYSEKGNVVRWETDKEMGSINSQSAMVVRTNSKNIKFNNRIVRAMKSGNWIEFTNTATNSTARYTLKGATKAINSIEACKY